jgi:proteic killer suppression protein
MQLDFLPLEESMQFIHTDKTLRRIDEEPEYTGGYSKQIVRLFRMRMQLIRSATDERDFYALASLHFEKLKGDRHPQRSMRLNKQFRLILQIDEGPNGSVVVILGIEDYH